MRTYVTVIVTMANSGPTIRERQVHAVLQDWPAEPTELAESVMDKYGPPDSVTSQRLVWYDNGPWKRSIVQREGATHHFPAVHEDLFEQVIDYRVPPKYCDELIEYDGSLHVRRTRGELASECRTEAYNFLALNLAHDIVTDEKTVGEARDALTMAHAKKQAGGNPEYMKGLQFEVPESEQRDPDRTTVDESVEKRAEREIR